MPTYLGQTVSDDYLQRLYKAYKAGLTAMGVEPPSSDQPILDQLTKYGITRVEGAEMAGRFDAIPSEQTHPEAVTRTKS